MKKGFAIMLVSLLFTVCSAAGVLAHDTWIIEENGAVVVAVGHHGDTEAYEPERVKDIVGYTDRLWPVSLEIEPQEGESRALVDEPFVAYTAFLDNEYWIQSSQGWKNQREKSGLNVLVEGRSYKYAKHISGWVDDLSGPLGQRFEIVALEDPTALEEGDKLPVQIYYEGVPLEKARLSGSSNIKGDTHQLNEVEGRGPFHVTVGPEGPQLITAKHVLQVEGEKKVAWFAATLSFHTSVK